MSNNHAITTLTSYWEYDRWLKPVDVVIAGSGIVGLSTALSIKEKHPHLRVLIAERGALPCGASTKNAGFACFGSITELADDLQHTSEEEIVVLAERRLRGLELLRKRLGDTAIEYEALGGYELFNSTENYDQYKEYIHHFNQLLQPITGLTATYRNADHELSRFGFSGVQHLIQNTAEGQLNTGRMMEALLAKAHAAGVKIITGLNIIRFDEDAHCVRLYTENGYELTAQQLIICTNGFAQQLLPDLPVNPARAQVLITKPIENLRIRGAFHYDRGYYYFRNVGNRLLFGGGRNLDFEGETTTAHTVTQRIQERLEELLQQVILPGINYQVEMRWAGTMGVGEQKKPIVKRVTPRVCCAVRMGGMGVALGSLVGEEIQEIALN